MQKNIGSIGAVLDQKLSQIQGGFHAIVMDYSGHGYRHGQVMTRAQAIGEPSSKAQKIYEFEFPVSISAEGNSAELAGMEGMPHCELWFLNIKTVEGHYLKSGKFEVTRPGRVKLVPGILSECPVHGVHRIPAGNYAWKTRKHGGEVRCLTKDCKEAVRRVARGVTPGYEALMSDIGEVYKTTPDEGGRVEMPQIYAAVREPKSLWERAKSPFETQLCRRAEENKFHLMPPEQALKANEFIFAFVLSLPPVAGWVHKDTLNNLCGNVSLEC